MTKNSDTGRTHGVDVLGQTMRIGDRVAYFTTGRYPGIFDARIDSFTDKGNPRVVRGRNTTPQAVMATQIVVMREQ